MAGLAGAHLSVAYTPLWVENMKAGKGWIGLALGVFATWRPLCIMLRAWLFVDPAASGPGAGVAGSFETAVGLARSGDNRSAGADVAKRTLLLCPRNRAAPSRCCDLPAPEHHECVSHWKSGGPSPVHFLCLAA